MFSEKYLRSKFFTTLQQMLFQALLQDLFFTVLIKILPIFNYNYSNPLIIFELQILSYCRKVILFLKKNIAVIFLNSYKNGATNPFASPSLRCWCFLVKFGAVLLVKLSTLYQHIYALCQQVGKTLVVKEGSSIKDVEQIYFPPLLLFITALSTFWYKALTP